MARGEFQMILKGILNFSESVLMKIVTQELERDFSGLLDILGKEKDACDFMDDKYVGELKDKYGCSYKQRILYKLASKKMKERHDTLLRNIKFLLNISKEAHYMPDVYSRDQLHYMRDTIIYSKWKPKKGNDELY